MTQSPCKTVSHPDASTRPMPIQARSRPYKRKYGTAKSPATGCPHTHRGSLTSMQSRPKYQKQYNEDNKYKISEARKQYNKQYYEENSEAIKEYQKQYREKNRDKILEYMREYNRNYYLKNKEAIDKKCRAYVRRDKRTVKKKEVPKKDEEETILNIVF